MTIHSIFFRCVFLRFFIGAFALIMSISAHAVVTLIISTPNSAGTYTVSWTGVRSYIDLYENSVLVARFGASPSSRTFTKPPGTYRYHAVDCGTVTNVGLQCVNSSTYTVVVAGAASSSSAASSVGLATSAGNPVSLGYEYDSLGRLKKTTENQASKTNYTYDKAGNRTQVAE